jgi:hypothetical protein
MDDDRTADDVAISWYAGPRERLRPLFALAEDSARRLDASLPAGRVLVATSAGDLIGCLQLVERAPTARSR